jgi:hypothetical protein
MTPKINLDWLFTNLKNYCIIKKPANFPCYEKKSDLDIICDDKIKFSKTLNEKITNKYELKTKSYIAANNNLQLDAIINGTLEIKFDISDDLSCFSKIKVNNELSKLILKNVEHKNGIFTPKLEHEIVIRLLEYEEYKHNPKKIKHLNFANKFPEEKNKAIQLIEKYKK